MQNVVIFREPKFKPLPGELTPSVINGATLPVKVEAAKRAIAACTDLSELLTWKDKLAALAAAAKMARMPEMARDVNRVHKEAILRMGQILMSYSGAPIRKGVDLAHKGRGATLAPSERAKAAAHVGLKNDHLSDYIRLASAPAEIIAHVIDNDRIAPSPRLMAEHAPRRRNNGRFEYTDAARLIFRGQRLLTDTKHGGLQHASRCLKSLSGNMDAVAQLTPEEKQRARKLVVEMQEILDEIDRRLGPAAA